MHKCCGCVRHVAVSRAVCVRLCEKGTLMFSAHKQLYILHTTYRNIIDNNCRVFMYNVHVFYFQVHDWKQRAVCVKIRPL